MMRYLFVFFVCCLLAHLSQGQCGPKFEKQYTRAKKIQHTEQAEAIQLLEKVLKGCPHYQNATFLLVDLLSQQKNVDQARRLLTNFIEQVKEPPFNAYLFLANLCKQSFEFKEAIKYYNLYLNSKATSRKSRTLAKKNLEDAQYSKWAYANYSPIEFRPLSPTINSPFPEYLPIMTADESLLVFTRREAVHENAYYSRKNEDGRWMESMVIPDLPSIFRKAGVSISADGKTLVLAMADDPRGIGNFDLYFIDYKNGKWQRPTNFGPNVNTAGWESQPCLSADGRTVFFSTDRRGGEGGHDIWKTKRETDGTWAPPTNLGVDVNGPKNEESPFLHRDQQTLYFRSNSHPGLGNYDIFVSRHLLFKKWTTPVNLGYPINTLGNDGSLFVSLDGETAYIASNINHEQLNDYKNQNDLQQVDIYKFNLHEKFRPLKTTYLRINFIDSESKHPLHPIVELLNADSGDNLFLGRADEQGEVFICLPFDQQYSFSTNLPGYVVNFQRFELDLSSSVDVPTRIQVELHPVDHIHVDEPILLKNVLFESNQATLQSGSEIELMKLVDFLKQNMSLNIVIHGHTDNVGEDEWNRELSLRRAQVVKEYLTQAGIQASRSNVRGWGKSKSIATNETAVGRKLNRRTEFTLSK